jgi:lactoylglutathione lyase/glyoxylase I family protein
MNIKSVAHVCIKTTDLEQTREFYCGGLGMTILFRFLRNRQTIGFYLKGSSSTFIEVFAIDATESIRREHTLNHFCLETEQIQTLRQTLLERGYSPGEIIMGADNTLQFWMQDPNGLNIEFQQYTERSAQFTGADVELEK